MYRYDAFDQQLIDERVAQFRDQFRRYQAGQLSEDEFRPLRLQNGLYIQRHAPMLRIAVPYGLLASHQLRKLADIARRYDHGYGHFSTRHNLQLNWPKLEDVPDILAELATVQMHAIQTSGNCVRNITTDPFAGIAPDEIIDPRPLAEILRQWSSFHPEFAYLPRKFKFAINGCQHDRAVVRVHDIGIELLRNAAGETGAKIWAGGGLGRTPIIGEVVSDWVPWEHIITYCEAILRLYNRYGRRDNSFKARIKILVKALGIAEFRRQVEAEFAQTKSSATTLDQSEYERVAKHFQAPAYETLPAENTAFETARATHPAFAEWVKRCVHPHRVSGYRAVTLSLKAHGGAPGNISAAQMESVADLADRYSFGEARVAHEQNLVLADVRLADLFELWRSAREAGLATPNIGLLTDIICCPGGDFCALANAKSIPIANAIQARFDNLDYLFDLGEIALNISGCMNSCGHHHVGHIGILGVDKDGSEWYQISLGGSQGNATRLGQVIGRAFAAHEVPDVIEKIIAVFVEQREGDERFIDVVQRLGLAPFKARVYGIPAKEEVTHA
ncbi:MAG: nitrite/sulfite reductase [Betaproteobacteria bacterium]|nr:nitrite/sulfite reductase [Betaproteobacteria bacterium]